jgi:hypothetical protein
MTISVHGACKKAALADQMEKANAPDEVKALISKMAEPYADNVNLQFSASGHIYDGSNNAGSSLSVSVMEGPVNDPQSEGGG